MPELKIETVKMIKCSDWDNFVREVYGRPYCYQQQDGCKSRGVVLFSVPASYPEDDEMNDSIPEVVNGEEMGVKFKVWLERDPKQPLKTEPSTLSRGLWWERNFYPDFDTVVNDLHEKGLLPEGSYYINIDW